MTRFAGAAPGTALRPGLRAPRHEMRARRKRDLGCRQTDPNRDTREYVLEETIL